MRLGDDAGAQGFGGRLVGIVVEHRGEALAQMPLDVIGEHAQTEVSPILHWRFARVESVSSRLFTRSIQTVDGH